MNGRKARASRYLAGQLLVFGGLACLLVGGCSDKTLLDQDDASPENGDFVVTFIDVGQGDAALLELPSGEFILIDGGPEGSGGRILSVLEEREIGKLDLVVLSHPHGDHYGGLRTVLNAVPVAELWENGESSSDYGYSKYREAVTAHGIPTVVPEQDEVRVYGEVVLRVLNREEGYKEQNNDSLVLKVSFGFVDFLFAGDIEREEAADLVQDYGTALLRSEVLKVPHHGSSDMELEFIEACSPDFAVISCSADNLYGHPHQETLDHYRSIDAAVYRTDLLGNVKARVDYDTGGVFFELN